MVSFTAALPEMIATLRNQGLDQAAADLTRLGEMGEQA